MAISVDWGTRVINVPQADLTPLGGGIYELDLDQFRLALKALEDDEAGMPFPDTHIHNTEVTVGSLTLGRVIEIINGYTVTFEDGQYAVDCVGANSNIQEVVNRNQVSIGTYNSAGLISPTSLRNDEAHLQAVYTGGTVYLASWLQRGNTIIMSGLVSCAVTWYDTDDSVLFTATDTVVGALGIFRLSASASLVANTVYTVDVEIVDGSGTVTTRRGVTVAT